jgi:hypothetical protein
MRRFKQVLGMIQMAALAFILVACAQVLDTDVSNSDVAPSATTLDFPYHPLVYHMDLSIMAYQMHGQSMVWPFDPFYEARNTDRTARDGFMAKVQQWATAMGAEQVANQPRFASFRGPGSLNGFGDNPTHDPIIYDYSLIHPWSNTLTNASGTWTEYLPPEVITREIQDVRVCYRPSGAPVGQVALGSIAPAPGERSADARDTMWAFEGGTGDKGEAGQPASQSLMGFILLRDKPEGGYDVHIAFRGSRSGLAGRAIIEALSDSGASGNPDWITDLGYNRMTTETGGALISKVGQVNRGFAESMRSILPNLMDCLSRAAEHQGGARPDSIYVTGHSLGGALAQTFVSAMMMGDRYGPVGQGPDMPSSMAAWPWSTIKLVTYSAPRVGDAEFARALTVTMLQSQQFDTALIPIDLRALASDDRTIVPRLLDHSRPVGFRVLNSRDPITTEKIVGGKHVGTTVYVNSPQMVEIVSRPDFSTHDQRQVRGFMVDTLQDPRVPPQVIQYQEMAEINPNWIAEDMGTRSEMEKLAAALSNYYASTGTWFDFAKYQSNVDLRFQISDQP